MLAITQPELISLELWRNASLSSQGVSSLCALLNLQELDIGWCTGVDAETGCVVRLVETCSDLVKLFLTAHRQTSDRDVLAIVRNLKNIQQLDIMGTRHVSMESIKTLLQSASNLTLLEITYCERLEDTEDLRNIKKSAPNCHIIHTWK